MDSLHAPRRIEYILAPKPKLDDNFRAGRRFAGAGIRNSQSAGSLVSSGNKRLPLFP